MIHTTYIHVVRLIVFFFPLFNFGYFFHLFVTVKNQRTALSGCTSQGEEKGQRYALKKANCGVKVVVVVGVVGGGGGGGGWWWWGVVVVGGGGSGRWWW